MLQNNRPRYWVPWYDRWHLLLPLVFLLLCLVALWVSCAHPLRATKLQPTGTTLQANELQTISGESEPNAHIRVYANGKLVGETDSDASGKFTLNLGALTPGAYQLRAVADLSGAQIESPEVAVNIVAANPTPDTSATTIALNANATATANALAQQNANATATALAQQNANATATALAQANANANANATATANALTQQNANATATANALAQQNANATATALAQANTNANASATATALAQTNANAQQNANATATTNAQSNANATATSTPANNSAGTANAPVIRQPANGAVLQVGKLGAIVGSTAGGETGVKVLIYDNDNLLGETVADNQALWAFQLPELAPGEHTLTAHQTAANGQELVSDVVHVTVRTGTEVLPSTGDAFATEHILPFAFIALGAILFVFGARVLKRNSL